MSKYGNLPIAISMLTISSTSFTFLLQREEAFAQSPKLAKMSGSGPVLLDPDRDWYWGDQLDKKAQWASELTGQNENRRFETSFIILRVQKFSPERD